MSEQDLSNSVKRLHLRNKELEEAKQKLDEMKPPEKHKLPMSYDEAMELAEEEQRFDYKYKQAKSTVYKLEEEVNEIEREVKGEIPTTDVNIQVSGKHKGQTYKLLVMHDSQQDKIVISE